MKFEIGTQDRKYEDDCLVCSIRLAQELILSGIKTYVKDNKRNEIIYGNYFEKYIHSRKEIKDG
jgi:hypothetical protein